MFVISSKLLFIKIKFPETVFSILFSLSMSIVASNLFSFSVSVIIFWFVCFTISFPNSSVYCIISLGVKYVLESFVFIKYLIVLVSPGRIIPEYSVWPDTFSYS